jgi:hypothetical protein
MTGAMLLYIDPGVGALLWQALAAAAVGALLAARGAIVNLFRRGKPPDDDRRA